MATYLDKELALAHFDFLIELAKKRGRTKRVEDLYIAKRFISALTTYHDDSEENGKWLYSDDDGWSRCICSNCGWYKNVDVHATIGYKFCPECGARMEE